MRKYKIMLANIFFLLITITSVFADHYPVDKRIDIKNYQFDISFSDKTDEINVTAFVTVYFNKPGVKQLRLDLVNKSVNTDGKGMLVDAVSVNNNNIIFSHSNNALWINLGKPSVTNSVITFQIKYHGVPADGLHAGPTKYGDRSFFSDNWPNKGRNWLPLIDHPSDKATCEFIIKAPLHYKVVSNGLLIKESMINDSTKLTQWKQSVPIATWLYTIGIADFAVQHVDQFKGKAIQTWVYAKDSVAGFKDFAEPTKELLSFFSGYVGPYVYEKLANVESPVVSGGMESASAIGYSEKLVTGDRSVRIRNVVIHELAHQWFGNAVTEKNWDDAWLSEGFATCFTMLFIEHAYGKKEFLSEWEKAMQSFKKYYQKDSTYKIVSGRTAEEEDVTNTVTYQKGACVLLMLRDMVGEAAFKKGIQSYYKKFMNANASTADFKMEMEKASHQNLTAFFNQWLHRGDLIRLKAGWKYNAAKKELSLRVNQIQNPGGLYTFPLDVAITEAGNSAPVFKKINIKKQSETFVFRLATAPAFIALDPRKVLLSMIELTKTE
ncbi:MAG: M1 family aminopeptidase [Ferruginibacter sp.]